MTGQEDTETIYVSEEEEGIRIDKLLSLRYGQKSRTYFQFLIEKNSVFLNGKKVKKSTIAKKDDEIEIFFILTEEISLQPQDIPLEIIYEDNDLIAINKPAGMVVHPAPGNRSNTFVNALLFHCKTLSNPENNLRPGIVHRLDKDTSGILLAAKNEEAHRKLIEQFSLRKIEKQYLAICIGLPSDQKISAPIGRNPTKRKEMTVKDDGKEAMTDITHLAQKDNISLILAKPKTGRTHQIRVHMKYINCPILGDSVYGSERTNKKFNCSRQLLHAYTIQFIHPKTNQIMKLSAPLPSDFQEFTKTFEPFKI